jgi:D-arginine dehydrogenase
VLVNAAGAWADELAVACGAAPLGLRALRRTAALIDAPAGVAVDAWPAVFDIDEQFYFKPDATRLLVSPAEEEPRPPGDVYADDLMVATGIERIESALDIEVGRVGPSWAGLRTFAPDRNPVIGFDTRTPGLFWCAGQGGYGIQSAPACAQLAAALARGEPVPPMIAAEGVTAEAVSPARFTPRGAT